MKHDKIGIYSITNIFNDKRYIGYSKNIYKRWSQHRRSLNNNKDAINQYLQNAWNKWKQCSFKFEILEECSLDLLKEKEIYWINFYFSSKSKFGYNIIDEVDGYTKYVSEDYNRIERVYTKIYKVDKNTNAVVDVYDSIYDISILFGLTYKHTQRILYNAAIGKGLVKLTYKGYFWISERIYNPDFDYSSLLIRKSWAKPKPPKVYKDVEDYNIKRNPISLQNIDTQEIRHFKSQKEAIDKLGFSSMAINCLTKGYKNKGGGKVVKVNQWKGWKIKI